MFSTLSSSSAPALRRSTTTFLLLALVFVASFVCKQAHAAQQSSSSSEQGGGGLSRKFSIHSSEEGERDSDGDGIGDFKDAFLSSLAMILVAELGDETFIIAAIMAMRHPRLIVLSGALSALAIMTVLSTALGVIAPMLISPKVVNKCAFVLYTFFGCRLFYIAWRAKPGQSMQEEVDEVAEKIDVDKAPKGKVRRILSRVCTPIFLEAFVLTFLAEWGDRSQITTIALAAHKDPYGVTIGAIVGHAFCTSLAVIGGKILALKISQRLVAAVGGMLFIVFAWHALIFGAPGTELSKN
jgi:putative Ca2+/H+ antiporter (TMEM165/GDT1 family)